MASQPSEPRLRVGCDIHTRAHAQDSLWNRCLKQYSTAGNLYTTTTTTTTITTTTTTTTTNDNNNNNVIDITITCSGRGMGMNITA